MAILSAKKDKALSTASFRLDRTEYRDVWHVHLDNMTGGASEAVSAGELPQFGAPFATDTGAVVRELTVSAVGDAPNVFDVTVVYSTAAPPDTQGPPGDPLLEVPSFVWGTITERVPMVKDIDGKPVVNSALTPFDPPVMRNRSIQTLAISRNESVTGVDVSILKGTYENMVNSDTFIGFGPGGAYMSSITVAEIFGNDGNFQYSRMTYNVYMRSDRAWDELEVLDAGLDEYVEFFDDSGPTGEFEHRAILRKVEDVDGNDVKIPVTEQSPLDGGGSSLIRVSFTAVTPADFVYLTFKPYGRIDFSGLGLFQTTVPARGLGERR